MARAKKKASAFGLPKADLPARDFVMARLAASRAAAQAAVEAIDDTLNLFVDPEEDDDGSEREELIGAALESIGAATRALESAEKAYDELDEDTVSSPEPWDAEAAS